VWVSLALIGCGAVAPDARAGCGDYVRILGPGGPRAADPGADGNGSGPPCHGPNCEIRDHVPLPLAPPTPPAEPPPPDAILTAPAGPETGPAAGLSPPRVRLTAGPGSGVYRPPRR
jgi:hypothetical protein